VFLFSLCLGIVIEAIKRLLKPEDIEDIELLLYVGIVGLLIKYKDLKKKLLLFFYFLLINN
jgi:Co/Zn/Cd efflux system component